MPDELHLCLYVLWSEIADCNSDAREGEKENHPPFPAKLRCLAGAQTPHLVELGGKKEAGLVFERSARQATAEEDIVPVFDGQEMLHPNITVPWSLAAGAQPFQSTSNSSGMSSK